MFWECCVAVRHLYKVPSTQMHTCLPTRVRWCMNRYLCIPCIVCHNFTPGVLCLKGFFCPYLVTKCPASLTVEDKVPFQCGLAVYSPGMLSLFTLKVSQTTLLIFFHFTEWDSVILGECQFCILVSRECNTSVHACA